MTGKDKSKVKQIDEGMVKKGGLNPKPSTPRPAEPPAAQAPKKPQGEKKD